MTSEKKTWIFAGTVQLTYLQILLISAEIEFKIDPLPEVLKKPQINSLKKKTLLLQIKGEH